MTPHPITAEFLREVGHHVQSLIQEHDVPGVSLGFLTPEGQHFLPLGVTNAEHPLPVTADTLFQIGSISKTFTGTLILRLVEAGKLDLDAPVRTYLPNLKLAHEDVAARLTLRHLLTHTAGFRGDVFMHTGDGQDALMRVVAHLANEPQITPLGELLSYNNAAFYLAGRVVEVITGQSFEAAMHELVFGPLHLTHTYFFPSEVMTHRFAAGHVKQAGQVKVARPWNVTRNAAAAGGVITSIPELLRYAAFHLSEGTPPDGQRLLNAATLRHMHTPQIHISSAVQMALTWFTRLVGPYALLYHGGATSGQQATLFLVPELKVAFASLTNADAGRALNNALTDWITQHWLGVPPSETPPLNLPATVLTEYAGQYVIPGSPPGDGFTLTVNGPHLLLTLEVPAPEENPVFDHSDTPPPAPLVFATPDEASIQEGPLSGSTLQFLRDPNGHIQCARFGTRIRLKRS